MWDHVKGYVERLFYVAFCYYNTLPETVNLKKYKIRWRAPVWKFRPLLDCCCRAYGKAPHHRWGRVLLRVTRKQKRKKQETIVQQSPLAPHP